MTDDLRRSGSTPEASTSGADVIVRVKAALDDTNCTDAMQDFFRVGDVRELLAEAERSNPVTSAAASRQEREARLRAETVEELALSLFHIGLRFRTETSCWAHQSGATRLKYLDEAQRMYEQGWRKGGSDE